MLNNNADFNKATFNKTIDIYLKYYYNKII